jgi:hypothetical protein
MVPGGCPGPAGLNKEDRMGVIGLVNKARKGVNKLRSKVGAKPLEMATGGGAKKPKKWKAKPKSSKKKNRKGPVARKRTASVRSTVSGRTRGPL